MRFRDNVSRWPSVNRESPCSRKRKAPAGILRWFRRSAFTQLTLPRQRVALFWRLITGLCEQQAQYRCSVNNSKTLYAFSISFRLSALSRLGCIFISRNSLTAKSRCSRAAFFSAG